MRCPEDVVLQDLRAGAAGRMIVSAGRTKNEPEAALLAAYYLAPTDGPFMQLTKVAGSHLGTQP